MAIANPRIHMICGICGCNKMLHFEVCHNKHYLHGGNGKFTVGISCHNCSSYVSLDEVITDKTDI